MSDADPVNTAVPGAQYAANEPVSRYSVDLTQEEVPNGPSHVFRDHVGKSDSELLDTLNKDRRNILGFKVGAPSEGSFASREAANDFVNRVLEGNRAKVDAVATGAADYSWLDKRFGFKTGREAYRPDIDTPAYLRDTYEVGVYIIHDPRSPRGYRVRTAYPRNASY